MNIFGSSARVAADAALDPDGIERREDRRGRKRSQTLTPARATDAVPADQCPRCGYRGPHATPSDCIAALRDRLSKWE
jgi:hypothetical protein